MDGPAFATQAVQWSPGSALSPEVDLSSFQAFAIMIPAGWQGVAGSFAGTTPVTNGVQNPGATQLLISGTAFSGIVQPGDKFVVGAQTFYATAKATPTGGTNITVPVYPAVGASIPTSTAVTYTAAAAVTTLNFLASPYGSAEQLIKDPSGTEYPVNYLPVVNDSGTAVSITVAPGEVITIATVGLAQALIPLRWIKLVSGTNAAPVAQQVPLTLYLINKSYD